MRYLAIFALIVFVSCEDNLLVKHTPPKISDSLFIEVMTDMHLMDALSKQKAIEDNRRLEEKYAQYKSVFKEHQISKSDFDTTMVYYTKHPKQFAVLYDTIMARLKQMEIQLYKEYSTDELE